MASGSYANIQYLDYSSEKSTNKVPSYQIDAANLATWLTGFGTYKSASAAITLGTQTKEQVVIYDTVLSATAPVNPVAQRESKLLVRFRGATSLKLFTMTIPTADLSVLTFADGVIGKSDYIVLADGGVMASWVTAFEAIARNPEDDSEAVTVESVQAVGRNN